MAERKGFEPPIPFPVYLISNQAPSATRPPLQGSVTICNSYIIMIVASMNRSNFTW